MIWMPMNPRIKNTRSNQDACDGDISAFSRYFFEDGSMLYSAEKI